MEEIVRVEQGKKRYLELLLLADPCEEMVDRYLDAGEMYVMWADGQPVCVCVMWLRPDGDWEIKNLATQETHQRRGYASRLVRALIARYWGRSRKLYVGTSNPAFYQRLGFAYDYTDVGFFTRNYPEPVIDEGQLCVDMIYLSQPLS